ncbi:MAG TPA: hypothetical protein PLN52_00060, partial [Opitutaceae bacterium]|nr:hypothetical protein [Opitutaceae bacterium]
ENQRVPASRAMRRTTKPSPPATSGRSRSRSETPERWPVPLAPTKPALAGVGALRGAPLEW